MTKQQVIIKAFCALSSFTNRVVFRFRVSSDCFCDTKPRENFQFDKVVLNFIIEAVNEKLRAQGNQEQFKLSNNE